MFPKLKTLLLLTLSWSTVQQYLTVDAFAVRNGAVRQQLRSLKGTTTLQLPTQTSTTSLNLWPIETDLATDLANVAVAAVVGTTVILWIGAVLRVEYEQIEKNFPPSFLKFMGFAGGGGVDTRLDRIQRVESTRRVLGLLALDSTAYVVLFRFLDLIRVWNDSWSDDVVWTPFGLLVLAVALTPYVLKVFVDLLGIQFPSPSGFTEGNRPMSRLVQDVTETTTKFLQDNEPLATVISTLGGIVNGFFEIYNDSEIGRDAEVGWKARFANLGLVLTMQIWFEFFVVAPTSNPDDDLLKNAYITWALFYMNALWQLRLQAFQDKVEDTNKDRLFKQLFHCIVAVLLWTAAGTDPVEFAYDRTIAAIQSFSRL